MSRIQRAVGFPRVAFGEAAVLVFLACFAAPAAVAYEREETFQKRIELQGAKRVIIENSRGDVNVIGEKGRTDLFCEYAKIIRGRDQDEADRLFNLTDIEIKREGAALKISARYPDRSSRDRGIFAMLMQRYAGLRIDMKLSVPPETAVEVVSASGDVEAVGVGDLKVDVSSGDISVSGVSGTAALSSSSGYIEASNVKGMMTVRSSSGELVLSELAGDLAAATVSGDVTVTGVGNVEYSGTSGSAAFYAVRGAVEAIAASGDIEVEATPEAAANYEMRTSSGDVLLRFDRPLKGGFALKVRTTSGDISTILPIAIKKVGRHHLTGVVREGKSIVVLETASGDIDVSEPEE